MPSDPVKHVTLVMPDNSVRVWRDIDARIEERSTDYGNGVDPHTIITVSWVERHPVEALPPVTAEEKAALNDD